MWTKTMDIVNSFTLLLAASLLFVVVVVCHAQKDLAHYTSDGTLVV